MNTIDKAFALRAHLYWRTMNDPSRPGGYDSDNNEEPPTLVEVNTETPSRKDRSAIASDDATPPPPCPVTILSGFLGSGKTTLIQYILRSPDHGKRIAVIENEYGEGLQVESLIARDGVNDSSLTDLIELPNGCICCTVKDSLVATLEKLLDKRQDLDYILIECSGMANPGPIASLFWLDDALESRLRLDGIVTLVDGKNIQEQLLTTEEAAQQIAYADRILLNKIDLLPSSSSPLHTIESLTEKLQRINPTAPIRPTQYSVVPDLDWVLEARCFDPDRLVEYHENCLTEPSAEHEHHHHDHSNHDCSACKHLAEHKHTNAVQTISIVESGSVDLDRVNKWLASILWPDQDEDNRVLKALIGTASPEGTASLHSTSARLSSSSTTQIFRIKGVLDAGPEDPRRHIVQAVHDLWEIHPGSDSLRWKPEEERKCKVVLIGRNLPAAELREGFRACCSS